MEELYDFTGGSFNFFRRLVIFFSVDQSTSRRGESPVGGGEGYCKRSSSLFIVF